MTQQNEVTQLKEQQSRLKKQWDIVSERARRPEQDPALFRRWPAAYVDVPAARLKAVEIARDFALVSADLNASSDLDVTETLETLKAMHAFCGEEFDHANKYADLKWPHTLTGRSRTEEIDTEFFKRKRDTATGALSAVRLAERALAPESP